MIRNLAIFVNEEMLPWNLSLFLEVGLVINPQQIFNDQCFLSITGVGIIACGKAKQSTL